MTSGRLDVEGKSQFGEEIPLRFGSVVTPSKLTDM